MLILKNTRREPLEVILPHDPICRRRGSCKCTIVDCIGPNGLVVKRPHAKSLRINALETLENVDDEVLLAQPLASAIKSGWIEMTRVAPAAPVAQPEKPNKGKKE